MTRRRATHFITSRNSHFCKTSCGLVLRIADPDFDESMVTMDVTQVRCGNCENKAHFRKCQIATFSAITGDPVRAPWPTIIASGLREGVIPMVMGHGVS